MILSSITLPRALRVASSNCDTKTSPRKTSNGKKACLGRHDCSSSPSSSSSPPLSSSCYSQNCCYVCRLFAICFVFLSSIVILETATVAAHLNDGRHRQVPIDFGSTNLRRQREVDAASLANDIGGQPQPQSQVTHGNYNTVFVTKHCEWKSNLFVPKANDVYFAYNQNEPISITNNIVASSFDREAISLLDKKVLVLALPISVSHLFAGYEPACAIRLNVPRNMRILARLSSKQLSFAPQVDFLTNNNELPQLWVNVSEAGDERKRESISELIFESPANVLAFRFLLPRQAHKFDPSIRLNVVLTAFQTLGEFDFGRQSSSAYNSNGEQVQFPASAAASSQSLPQFPFQTGDVQRHPSPPFNSAFDFAIANSGDSINGGPNVNSVGEQSKIATLLRQQQQQQLPTIIPTSSQFICDGSRLISSELACDGYKNCIDGSDEHPTVCPKNVRLFSTQHSTQTQQTQRNATTKSGSEFSSTSQTSISSALRTALAILLIVLLILFALCCCWALAALVAPSVGKTSAATASQNLNSRQRQLEQRRAQRRRQNLNSEQSQPLPVIHSNTIDKEKQNIDADSKQATNDQEETAAAWRLVRPLVASRSWITSARNRLNQLASTSMQADKRRQQPLNRQPLGESVTAAQNLVNEHRQASNSISSSSSRQNRQQAHKPMPPRLQSILKRPPDSPGQAQPTTNNRLPTVTQQSTTEREPTRGALASHLQARGSLRVPTPRARVTQQQQQQQRQQQQQQQQQQQHDSQQAVGLPQISPSTKAGVVSSVATSKTTSYHFESISTFMSEAYLERLAESQKGDSSRRRPTPENDHLI